ncbi:polysaccharide deacetylase family protein [Sphingosinicella sp. CPCC 101087]|uniref:polysaccharide deacetylase family protein n=1 Tax=Sphingosinicella sp. CPCC 101087 TaxID=2497754 RepID=UPI001FB111C2|nr:polysaccharide deacetylase family protein [Sphingosinicella sp. CPCC 101087]
MIRNRMAIFLVALLALATPSVAQKRIALTFDDVPRHPGAFFTPDERTAELIAALDRAGVEQAAFFVTTGNLDEPFGAGGEERIAAYVAAGHVIANHSQRHLWLHRTPAEDYVADLDRASAWLSGRPGYRPWFRFPYLDEGREDVVRRDALRAALRGRGLSNGYVTVDTYDWFIENLVNESTAAGRTVDRDGLRDLYVESVVGAANFAEAMAVETLGRSPAHVILLHETDIAALFIDDAVTALRADGWEIVTADEAFSDPIASIEPDTTFLGAGRIAAIAHARGTPAARLVSPWTEEAVLTRLFAERVLHQTVAP